jgi:hypothetical protein
MNKVIAVMREAAVDYFPDIQMPFAVVSIYTPPGYPSPIPNGEAGLAAYLKKYPGAQAPMFGENENCKGILPLGFFDLEHTIHDKDLNDSLILFDYDMAFALKEFIDSVKDDIDLLMVHCDAGVSRSQAVRAVVLRSYLKESDDIAFREGTPNMLVYKIFLNVMLGYDPHKLYVPFSE